MKTNFDKIIFAVNREDNKVVIEKMTLSEFVHRATTCHVFTTKNVTDNMRLAIVETNIERGAEQDYFENENDAVEFARRLEAKILTMS